MGMEVPESMYIHEPALWVRLETDASNARTVRGISFSATEIPAGNRRDVRIWILTLKVPEKLQLYGLYVYYVVHICDFGMNQTGGVESTPPSTFCAIISRNFFPAHRAFATFFFQVLRNFWCYFRKNRAYRSEVTQRYVIERRLKIWEFSGFVYKTYGKWLFVLKIHFGL